MSRKRRQSRSNRKNTRARTNSAASIGTCTGPSVAVGAAADLSAAPPDSSVRSPGDFQVKFFDELPADAWLTHELELRDPRFLRKMTEAVARRRALFAKYVVGVVAVSAVLCVAALAKLAVPGAGQAGQAGQDGTSTSLRGVVSAEQLGASPEQGAPASGLPADSQAATERPPAGR